MINRYQRLLVIKEKINNKMMMFKLKKKLNYKTSSHLIKESKIQNFQNYKNII